MNLEKTSQKNVKLEILTGRTLFMTVNYILLSVISIVSIIPLINLLAMSFSSNSSVVAGQVGLWPVGFNLFSYEAVMGNKQFLVSTFNSVVRTVLGIIINMSFIVMVAYPLSKSEKELRIRKIYVWFFFITMLFPAGIIPLFMTVKYTGIYNTVWSLILPYAVPVFNVLIMMNFLRELPKEIEEAAFIDGAGHITTLIKIILPLTKPVLATLFLFSFVNHWNSWYDGLMFMREKSGYPLQTYLQSIITIPDISSLNQEQLKLFSKINHRSMKAAQIFIAALPIFIIYPFLQKYFTKGLVLGSVKG